MKKINRFDLAAVLVLVLIILVFFRRGISGEGVFFGADEIGSDIMHLVYTHHEFTNDSLRRGKIPLWNPYAGSGSPVFGEAQSGLYNPIEIILYHFLPSPLAFNWLIISTFMLAVIGTYIYARSLGILWLGAFLAALSFTLSGFMVGQLRHLAIINTVAFMPLAFFACEQIIKSARFVYAAILAFLIFLSFSPGHLTTTYLMLFMMIAYFLARFWFEFSRKERENLRPVIVFFLGLILGVIAAAGTIMPAVEMIGYSSRASFSLESALSPVFKIKYFLLFLSPYLFGDPSRGSWDIRYESYWENIGYIGLLPLFFAQWALFWGIKKRASFILSVWVLLAFCVLMLLGSSTFFYNLVRLWIPGFSFTRVPGRFLLYIDFFGAILAGFALAQVFAKVKGKNRAAFAVIVLTLTVYDLFHFGYNFNTVMPVSYFDEPNSVKFLRKDPDLFRIRPIDFEHLWQEAWVNSHGWRGDLSEYIAQREVLPPDVNLTYRLASPVFLYGKSGRYGVKHSIELDQFVLESLNGPDITRAASLLGMENVKYLLTQTEFEATDVFERVASLPTEKHNKTTYIYLNKKWLPRAFLVGKSTYIEKDQDVLKTMIAGDFDMQKEVIVQKDLNRGQTEGKGQVVVESYQDDKVDLGVTSNNGGYLVLTDTYYPGWKAYIDGREVEIVRANYAYRAIYIEGGNHKVVFSYEPASVKIGFFITVVTLVAIILIGAWDILRVRKLRYFKPAAKRRFQ